MSRIFWVFLSLFIFLLVSSRPAQAIVNPLSVPNNRFGIHILEPADIPAAAALVNSQGGDWGYVTLIIRQNDRDKNKWQTVFDQLRRLHLIPLVRLATNPEKNYWVKPEVSEVQTWVDFLNSLNWVVTNRYVILFNEPNHALEWENSINPSEYSSIVRQFHDKLKAASEDFFILPAGLDTAAPNSNSTLSAVNYWQRMYQADHDIFTLFDGWNSHSYPNPDFSGLPTAKGLGTLQSYQAEVNYLATLGLNSSLPIFITETGWTNFYSNNLTDRYTQAFTQIWTQSNLVTITPFILNYSESPFNQFSWRKPNSADFYPHYYAVQSLPKIAGRPEQNNSSSIVSKNIPGSLIDNSVYEFSLSLTNTGQSIWTPADFSLLTSGDFPPDLVQVSLVNSTEPFQTADFKINLKTPPDHQDFSLGLQLSLKGKPFGEKFYQTIKVVPPPSLVAHIKMLFKRQVSGNDFQLLVYDERNELQTKLNLQVNNGLSQPVFLYNLVPENLYRFVLLKPEFLPRQLYSPLNPKETEITFKPLLPNLFKVLLDPLNYLRLRL
ncbi:MAG: hypothetical protein NTZ93_03290 [Candidatus Beckwithbacteria bacterium]|nr:hypothetical protein [Candidatus Beckwithbacteria bacterium]